MRTTTSFLAAVLLVSPPLLAQAVDSNQIADRRSGRSLALTQATDWNRIADLMVARTLALAPGERVVIHHDATKDPGLVTAVRAAITRAGGVIAGELVWPAGAVAAVYDSMSPATLAARVAREDSSYLRLMKSASIYLWLHAPSHRDVPRRIEKLIAASGARAIHFHWTLPSDPAEAATAAAMYEKAIAVAPAELDRQEGAMERALKGAQVRLTSPGGTDLRFTIPANAWFHRNTGSATKQKTASARTTRDREEELPAGVLRTTDLRAAEGVLVATTIMGTKSGTVRVTFRGGRVTAIEGQGSAGQWLAGLYAGATGDKDKPAELVVGFNPELLPILPSGFMPYYGYGSGIVRIAIGDNWESGGTNRAGGHWEQWLFVVDGTLTANDKVLVRDGKLVP
jgi:leucyl aminopeptidase (aminopeptidase T)